MLCNQSMYVGDNILGKRSTSDLDTTNRINNLVNVLEKTSSTKFPTRSPLLNGCWRLLFTSSPGTNSPIQRTFTASSSVSVFQVVNVNGSASLFLPQGSPEVSNIVCFGDKARLRVTALASTVVI